MAVVAMAGTSLTAMLGSLVGLEGEATATSVTVRTVLGPSQLETPGGLALDTAGDLFVADTGHCRVLELAARSGVNDGRHRRAGRVTTVAGGSCTGPHAFGHPTGVAVDPQGDVFVAEATAQRILEVRPGSPARAVTVVGTGQAGFNGNGLVATSSQLDQPTSVALDAAGDLYIADTANCRARVIPSHDTTLFGQTVTPGHLYTVAGTGVCGSAGQGGPAGTAQLWNPVAVAVDPAGNLLVADRGDQSVLLAAARTGAYFGTTVPAGNIAVVVGGTGSYGPYLGDGLPAAGATAELNDPRGLALAPAGTLFVTDGFMHALRVAPAVSGTVLGRAVKAGDLFTAAGAVPVTSTAGAGDGTRWVLTHLGTPTGVAVSAAGVLYVADAARDTVLAIGAT